MAVTGFYTPTGVHIRGNRKVSSDTRQALSQAFDLAEQQAIAEIELAKRPLEDVALAAVEIISERIERGTWHYWHCNGYLLTTLDEVVRALEDGELREAA